jgi:hypothetical protein
VFYFPLSYVQNVLQFKISKNVCTLLPHMTMLVAVIMLITIGSIKYKCLYREACGDAASADQYVTFSPSCSSVFAYDIVAWFLAHYLRNQYGGWHNVIVSRDVGQVSSLSVGMVAQYRFCQWGWHSIVTVSRDGGTVSFLSVGMVAQYRYCQ